MKRIRKILVPVDFSPSSETAMRSAVGIAHHRGARISLLHVYPFAHGSMAMYRTLREIEADTGNKSGKWTGKSKKTLAAWGERISKQRVPVKKYFAIGRPANEIKAVSLQIGADLIVMGTRGLGGLRGAVLGHTAMETVRAATVPVLTVHRGRMATAKPPRVLVADDFGTGGDGAIDAAAAFGDVERTRVLLLHVVDVAPLVYAGPAGWGWASPTTMFTEDEKLALAKLKQRGAALERKGFKVQCRVVTGAPALSIARIARSWRASLLVVATHGRRGVARVLMGNTAEKLLNSAHCPILAVRPESKVSGRKKKK